MQGITTAIIVFQLYCIAFPHLIRHKSQFYATVAMVCAIILLDTLGHMIGNSAFVVFVYSAIGFLQVVSFLGLLLSAGGLTASELGGEMGRAYEVLRRGETQKEVIVPLSGEMPRKQPPAAASTHHEPEHTVYTIDNPVPGTPVAANRPSPSAPLPLD